MIDSTSCVRWRGGRTSGMAVEVWSQVKERPLIIRVRFGLGPVLLYVEGAV